VRKVIAALQVSVDGFIEGPNGERGLGDGGGRGVVERSL
jgi:hypothetical protein